ncbi:4Fe-4S binding protein [Perlabentimonas gracilis]|uniref:4Fe-4S binding protein n=1 Tax=Perlabentimonas gracilis TaxID=2715279 RepID=UPI00140DDF02|nr:ATP-binding protein [Perlabentimonas gracilis]NHB69729.1 4Fe-4S binding protein [Perlabentimonas gracilis]
MEVAIISGKGGTGKSSISAAFATLSEQVLLADCDVDAANLYIIFNPTHSEEQVYIAGQTAVINYDKCIHCGLCMDYCRFDAISNNNGRIEISETSCDGCQLCSRVCPQNAIIMVDNDKSRMYSGDFRNGKMVYGRLAPGEENSGKLVNMVREKAKQVATENNLKNIVIDGPPGIGCAVISSITGVDHVLIVTEPTISGLHDLKRTLEMVSKFNLKPWVLVNKFDLNADMAQEIEMYCTQNNVSIAGRLPFDSVVVDAMVNCKSIIEWAPDSEISHSIKSIWNKIASN